MPFWFGRPLVPAVPIQPPRRTNFDPVAPLARPARAHLAPFFVQSAGVKATVFAGIGEAGAATLVLRLDRGFAVTFGWQTSIIPSYSGKEQRESLFAMPQRSFDGPAFLLDAGSRDARGAIQRAAAAGATFLLALPFEAVSLTQDSSTQTVFVANELAIDWAFLGQRVAVAGVNGTFVVGVIQAITVTSLRLDVIPGATGKAGGLIMPLIQVLLQRQQNFSRHPTAVDTWSIRARSKVYGWGGGWDAHGAGAQITTFTVGAPVPASTITDFDLIVWDKTNAIDNLASESADSGSEILDVGGSVSGAGAFTVPTWQRSLKLRSNKRDTWQYWKAFTRLCRGQQRAWLLSTNRPDLVYDSTITGGIKIKSASVVGGGDYVSWFASDAHRRLSIRMTNGTVQFAEVILISDNLDGTISLILDADVTATPAKISFLELVRFARNELVAQWNGEMFDVAEPVVTVQEAVDAPSRNFFDKETAADFRYTGVPPDVPPATQTLFVPIGKVILVHWTSDRSLSFSGIHVTGGNVDGTVVCISVNNTAAFGISLQHENVGAVPSDQLRNSTLATISGVAKSYWYRYRQAAAAGVGRWIQIM